MHGALWRRWLLGMLTAQSGQDAPPLRLPPLQAHARRRAAAQVCAGAGGEVLLRRAPLGGGQSAVAGREAGGQGSHAPMHHACLPAARSCGTTALRTTCGRCGSCLWRSPTSTPAACETCFSCWRPRRSGGSSSACTPPPQRRRRRRSAVRHLLAAAGHVTCCTISAEMPEAWGYLDRRKREGAAKRATRRRACCALGLAGLPQGSCAGRGPGSSAVERT